MECETKMASRITNNAHARRYGVTERRDRAAGRRGVHGGGGKLIGEERGGRKPVEEKKKHKIQLLKFFAVCTRHT